MLKPIIFKIDWNLKFDLKKVNFQNILSIATKNVKRKSNFRKSNKQIRNEFNLSIRKQITKTISNSKILKAFLVLSRKQKNEQTQMDKQTGLFVVAAAAGDGAVVVVVVREASSNGWTRWWWCGNSGPCAGVVVVGAESDGEEPIGVKIIVVVPAPPLFPCSELSSMSSSSPSISFR